MRFLIIISLLLIPVTMHCDNPFFPPRPATDRPLEITDELPNSPAGVINQLFKSYKYRNISLYTSLLASDFRFYVASGFASTKFQPIKDTMPDTFMVHVPTSNSFNYWGYAAEVHSTKNMFENTRSIEIDQYQMSAPVYHNDSLYAEVMVSNLLLHITIDIGFEYTIANKPQVFLLKQTDANVWVIWKWYDLGTEG